MSAETGIPIEYDPSDLPCGFDRADGDGGRLGTPTSEDQILAESYQGIGTENLPVEEMPDSPVMEYAEQDTVTHKLRMPYDEAVTRTWSYSRGIIRTDSNGNMFKLLSTTVQHEAPGKAVVTTVEEMMTGDTPPDNFEVQPVEMGLNIIKHPRYLYAFIGDASMPETLATGDSAGGYGSVTEGYNQMVIRLLQDYMENTSYAFRNAIVEMFKASMGNESGTGAQPPYPPTADSNGQYQWAVDAEVSGTDMAKAAALEIITKYWRGEETPSVVAFNVCWTEYFWTPPEHGLNPGGYVEDPITEGGLPEYFWSTVFPSDGSDPKEQSIFSWMSYYNPQCYSSDGSFAGDVRISWRREADVIERQRTFFAIQHRWTGSAIGHWDEHLYTQNERPMTPSDYTGADIFNL
jgi:hypothetical protein